MGVDEGSGLIRKVVTTPPNVNDTTPADELIRGDEAVEWADAAYDTHARRARLKAEGKKPRFARRPTSVIPTCHRSSNAITSSSHDGRRWRQPLPH